MTIKIKQLFFLTLLFIFSQFSVAQREVSLSNFPENKIMVVAHRGDWRNAPENSLQAVENCIKMGVDIVEIDLQKTKDGTLIIMHDKTIDRTTTGSGKVSGLTLDSIKSVWLKNGVGGTTKQKVPTLTEMMKLVKGQPILVNLDKAWEYFDDVMQILEETKTTNQVILKGNKTISDLRAEYGSVIDRVAYMPMVWPEDYSIYQRDEVVSPLKYTSDFIKSYRPVAFEVIINNEQSTVLDAVNLMKKEHILVWVNTLWDELCAGHSDELALKDPDKHWGWALSIGANIIQTDNPKELIDYLKSKGLKY